MASEARYRDLFELSPSPLVLHRRGSVLDANDAAVRLFGFADVTTIIGSSLFDLFAEGEQRERADARAAAFEYLPVGDALPVVDYQMQSLQGRTISVQVTGVRVDAVGGPAVLAIFFDITGRKAAEAALRRSEAMLSHLFATSPDLMTLTELPSGRFTMVNESFTRMTGYTSAEAVGHTALELGLWHSTEQRERFIASMLEHGSVNDLRAVFVTKSGKLATMRGSAARFLMDGRAYMVINARDVTEAERAQLEHEAILQRASIGIGLTRERRFVRVNPRFERMFGWDSGELNGQSGSVVWPNDEDYAEVGRSAGPLLSAGQPVDMECPMRRRDGSLFWCRLMAQAVDRTAPGTGDTIWIAEDVTERRQTDQALAAARDAAEAASRAKSAFLANTSHEIRTPLNGLLGLARLALQPALDEGRRQQYLNQILDSAQSLAGIISDILDLSKIEAGKITLEDLPFALPETLVAVHHAYLSLAQGKGLELALAIDDTVPTTVSGDALRLRQILSNYITNALKFTERGQVRLHAEGVANGRVRLNVEDTGPGIDLDTQQRLFMPFTQADESTTRRFGGTGLGLSICRELAHLMGGEVGVHSNPGLGSRFWVELPLRAVAAADRVGTGETDDLNVLRGARVLMVEDNPVNMMIAVATLEQWEIDVEQATDGARAVEAVLHAARTGRPFDMVLMDVHMPVMSGHEAARALREHPDGATLPIIALTAAALVSEREEAMAAGMNDFLTKPIDSGKLLQTLARHVRRTAEV
jgi:PAS domain S-box-containing protein